MTKPNPDTRVALNTNLLKRTVCFGGLVVSLLGLESLAGSFGFEEKVATWEQKARTALGNGDLAAARQLAEEKLSETSSAAAAHLVLGTIELRRKHHSEAAAHFQSANQLGAQQEELFLGWSEALQGLGRASESCQMLEAELLRDSSRSGLRSRLADLYLTLGKPQQALPHLEEVYRQGTKNVGITFQLASARFAAGQDYRAVDLLEPLIGSTSSANLLLQTGKLYFRNLLYRQAVAPLKRAWELSRSYETGMFLALTYFQLSQYANCAAIVDQIMPNPAEALEHHILKGSALARLGDWDKARRELEQAVASAEDRADGYFNLGLFWMERGDRQKAWELLKKGARTMTSGTKVLYTFGTRQNCDGLVPPKAAEPRNKHRAEFFSQLAETFHKTHHWISALELFQAALEDDFRIQTAYGGIGLICQELGSPEVGASFLQRGIELHPNEPNLRFYFGTVLSSLGRHEEALSNFIKALELDGPNPPARHWLFLGMAQVSGKRETQKVAKVAFQRAIELDPQLALAHYELGKWHLKEQDFELAEKSLRRAIELDPHLLAAYYQYGIACIRNGNTQRGEEFLAAFQKKKALREPSSLAQQDRLRATSELP